MKNMNLAGSVTVVIVCIGCAVQLVTCEETEQCRVASSAGENDEPKVLFSAVGSKVVRPHEDYPILFNLESSENDAKFTASIRSKKTENENYESEEVQISPGGSSKTNIKVGSLDPKDQYELYVTVKSLDDVLENSTALFIDDRPVSVLIQTDKSIYKPGEAVKFRVIALGRTLKKYKDEIEANIVMKDAQDNIVKKWSNVMVPPSGLISEKFKLSSDPVLGNWKISVTTDKSESTKDHVFSIEKYVLPKFQVEVNLPTFATYDKCTITAEIKATYTYGKPVNGRASVKFREALRYESPRQKKTEQTVDVVNGVAYVNFNPKKDLGISHLKGSGYTREFEISATVVEEIAGRRQNASAKIPVHDYPYDIELVDPPSNYKPGFPVKLTFKIKTQDDAPVIDEDPQALKVKHGFSYFANDSIRYSSIPPNGLVTMEFETPSNDLLDASSIEATYKDLTKHLNGPRRKHSQSKRFVQVDADSEAVPGEVFKAYFRSSHPSTKSHYVIQGDGKVLDAGTKENDLMESIQMLEFEMPKVVSSQVRLTVYSMVGENNELVADSTSINNKGEKLDNFLNISARSEQAEPGDKARLTITTNPGSLVALRGVDQSVLLLKEDKNIDLKAIEDELDTLDSDSRGPPVWGRSDAYRLFNKGGLAVVTNGEFDHPTYHPYPIGVAYESLADRGQPGAPMRMKNRVSAGVRRKGSVASPKVRTKFPETWIWNEMSITSDTQEVSYEVPDTMTSWIISGYSINPELGMGAPEEPLKITTFRPFFMTVNKPYSVVQGEVLALQVLVHNYQDADVNAEITFDNKEQGFKFSEGEGKKNKKEVLVKSNNVNSVTFLLVPEKFGYIKLSIKAKAKNAGDAIEQLLLVKPPGKEVVVNKGIFVDLKNQNEFQSKIETTFPEDRVKGADMMKISVIGDVIGTSLNNLHELLALPTGCGEQNMLNFVPDVMILKYLNRTATSNPEIVEKALNYLETGYQRELTYRHTDGSFSAFGKSDPKGSTWLTAFVVRYFIIASEFITIDEKIIESGLKFLVSQQQDDGEFRERGKVLHSGMQGGLGRPSSALTAYVLLAFFEANNHQELVDKSYDDEIKKGIEFVLSNVNQEDPYEMALVTYTLHLFDHAKKDEFYENLMKLSTVESSNRWWEKKKTEEDIKAMKSIPWYSRTKPVDVEMTSYALLTEMKFKEGQNAFPIVRWLLSQRNDKGGFLSTQDTVVGLEALTEFAMESTSENDMKIMASGDGFDQKVSVDKSNSDVLQQFSVVPKSSLDIKAEGSGTAVVQVTWKSYVVGKTEDTAFWIDVQPKSVKNPSMMELNVCSKYTRAHGKSNMAVMEVNLPSGFEFDSETEEMLRSLIHVMRVDLEEGNTRANIYFDSIGSEEVCVDVKAEQVYKLANLEQPYVKVYDYYDTTKFSTKFYDPPTFDPCDICKVEDDCVLNNCVPVP